MAHKVDTSRLDVLISLRVATAPVDEMLRDAIRTGNIAHDSLTMLEHLSIRRRGHDRTPAQTVRQHRRSTTLPVRILPRVTQDVGLFLRHRFVRLENRRRDSTLTIELRQEPVHSQRHTDSVAHHLDGRQTAQHPSHAQPVDLLHLVARQGLVTAEFPYTRIGVGVVLRLYLPGWEHTHLQRQTNTVTRCVDVRHTMRSERGHHLVHKLELHLLVVRLQQHRRCRQSHQSRATLLDQFQRHRRHRISQQSDRSENRRRR